MPGAQTQAEVGDAKPIHYQVNGFGLLVKMGVECGNPISLEFPSYLLIAGRGRQIRIALSRLTTLIMINSFLAYLGVSHNLNPVKLNIGVRTRLTTRMLWAVALITVVFTFVNMSQIAPNDFWWHMAVGRDILATGQIPAVDVYSYTMAGQPYLSYQMFWLMDVWLYGWFSLGGAELILFIQSLIITATYLIILVLCWQNSHKWGVTSFCLIFTILLGIYAWNVRPQAIAFLIGMIFLYAIYAYRRGANRAWLAVFPLGMLVWVNSHGSFLVGLLLLGIWLGDETWQVYAAWRKGKRYSFQQLMTAAVILLLTTGVCTLNPRGMGIISYLITMTSNPAVQNTVPEWLPPSFTSPIGPIYFISILFSAVVLALSPRRPSFYQLATFVAFAALGLWTTRGVVWFGLVMAPVLADHLSAIRGGIPINQQLLIPNQKERFVNSGILCLLISLALISLPWFRGLIPMRADYRSPITQDTPVAAASFLVEQQPDGRIFNDMAFGSYLIWAAQPDYKVFADPRIELFPQDIWDDYQVISRAAPGWEQKLVDYEIRTLFLNPSVQGQLVQRVAGSDQWRLIYQDETAQIYQRRQ